MIARKRTKGTPKPFNATAYAIVQKIREIRLEKQYSQYYMAAKLKISQNAYSKNEIGESELGLERFLQIAEILEVDYLELIRAATTNAPVFRDEKARSNSRPVTQ